MAVKGLKVNSLNMSDDVPGMVLLNTTSFSAVATSSLSSVFSTTYDNYRIVVNISTNSANDGYHYFKVRSGSTDASSSYFFSSYTKTAGNADSSFTSGAGGTTYLQIGQQDNSNTGAASYSLDIISPFLAQYTKLTGTISYQNDSGNASFGVVGGVHGAATSYDGFTLGTQNGTFTGTVSLYGYNK
jgi:hypothetical protein